MRVLIADTETGGLKPREHSCLSVGALAGDLDTGEILETFESYVRLPNLDDYNVTPGSIEVHGITPEQAFRDGIPPEEIAEQFADLHTNYNVMHCGGHNFPFDVEVMSFHIFGFQETEEFRANFGYRMLDSLPVVRLTSGMDEVKSGRTVEQAVKALGIDMSDYGKKNYHAALFDSVCTFRILHRYRQVFTNPEVVTLLNKGK